MKMIGNDVYIQRGETWSFDRLIQSVDGHPYMLFKEWQNPYIAITVTAARYEQKGDFRRTWWLDVNNRWEELSDGTFKLVPMKRFIGTEALYTTQFSITNCKALYPDIVFDKTSEFDITNYLFFTDDNADGGYVYKYVEDYVMSGTDVVSEIWTEYSFRIVKQFITRDWMEQNYLYDIKVLSGESVKEHIHGILVQQGLTPPVLPWADEVTIEQLKLITDRNIRNEMQELFDSGQPLMPEFDVKSIILEPTKLTVSTNIMGGIK